MRDILLGSVIAAAGKVDSRVKLQKLVYLLQRMGFDLGFHDTLLRDFGPFSSELATTIDSISRPDGMVKETKVESRANATGATIVRYSYEAEDRITPLLFEVAKAFFGDSSDKFVQLARRLSKAKTRVLEVAATAVYLREEMNISDDAQLWDEVRQRKGHLPSYFESAERLLAEWDKEGLLGSKAGAQTG